MGITRRNKKGEVHKLKRSLMRKSPAGNPVEFISSGGTILNLSLSNKGIDGGWGRGRVHNIVGDGSSGKTLLALEEAFWFFNNIKTVKSNLFPKVKQFEICYDNGEGVMDFPITKMYGEKFEETVNWERSKNFEAMCRRFIRKSTSLKKGEALLYVIDSWDSFQSAKSKAAFMESVKKDEDLKGDYDLLVQKYASRKFFPNICDKMDNNKMDATLCIISQVRSKINATFGKKQYRAGGKALDFYTHQVVWIRELKRLSKTKLKQEKVYGIKSHAKVERSKVAKPFRESEFTILYDYGLDDINSMIDFLWGSKTIRFKGRRFESRKEFIQYIENGNHENRLRKKVERLWWKVEDLFEQEVRERKPRF